MRRVRCEDHPSNSEGRAAALLQFVRADVRDPVFALFGISRQDLFVPHGLSLDVFLATQSGDVAVRDSVETVLGDLCGHIPVRWVHDEVRVPEAVLGKVVIYLRTGCVLYSGTCIDCIWMNRGGPIGISSLTTYVCGDNLSIQRLTRILRPKQLFPNSTARPIAAHDIFCLSPLAASRGLNLHPRLVLVLPDFHDSVRPLHCSCRQPLYVLIEKYSKPIQRKHDQLIWIVLGKMFVRHARNECFV